MKTINTLILTAKQIYNVDPTEKTQERPNVYARNAVYAVARDCYGLTFQGIGKAMKKHHATVLYGYRQHEILLKYDKEYNALFQLFYDITHCIPAEKVKFQILNKLSKLDKDKLDKVLNYVNNLKN